MLRLLSIPFGLVMILAFTLAWSGSRTTEKAEFTFINRGDIITLDLNQMSYMQDFRITYGIREGLYSPKPGTLEPIPAAAEGHEVSPDGRIYTFHIRKNAKWNNGDPVTAHDFVFSWRRLLEEPGEYTYLFYYIHNAKAYEESYTKGEPINFAEVGITALDDHTFRVTLTDPVPYLLELLAFPPFYPRHERSMAEFREFADRDLMLAVDARLKAKNVDLTKLTLLELWPHLEVLAKSDNTLSATQKKALSDAFERKCLKYSYRNEYTRPPKVVTNGPFELKQWEFKRFLLLTRSPTYWDAENVKLNSLRMVVNDNVLSQFLQYEAGSIDWLADIPADLARDLVKKNRKDVRVSKAFGTSFMTLMVNPKLPSDIENGGKNPLADVRVRQALAMAIDKEAITRDVTGMGEEVATTFTPPGTLSGYDPPAGLKYDVKKARELLAEAGYPNGAGFPRLPILYNSGNTTRERIVQVLQEQWKNNLNIDLQLQTMEVKMYRNKITNKQYAIGTAAWYGDYPDVTTFTDKYKSDSLQNDCDWVSKEYDDLCLAATKEADAVKRLELLRRAEYILNTEVPIIPLYHYVNTSMRSENVLGIEENPRGVTVFKGVSMKPGVN